MYDNNSMCRRIVPINIQLFTIYRLCYVLYTYEQFRFPKTERTLKIVYTPGLFESVHNWAHNPSAPNADKIVRESLPPTAVTRLLDAGRKYYLCRARVVSTGRTYTTHYKVL